MYYTKEQYERAKEADLAQFLLQLDPDHHKIEGDSVRVYEECPGLGRDIKKAISIKMGESWYHDFSTDESHSGIDYLVRYMGYDVKDAVLALAGEKELEYQEIIYLDHGKAKKKKEEIREVEFPEESPTSKQMYAYLCSRGIPEYLITHFHKIGLLYQSTDHNNIVFINHDRDFAEIRGTYTYGEQAFHQVIKTQANRYWAFNIGKPEKAYICEAAIDAISLYVLHKMDGCAENAKYVSIAGVGNQKTINRVKLEMPVVMAVDRDIAGDIRCFVNSDCERIIPINKDWNEDLQARLKNEE